ncbi:ankyrin repeat-containing domain protein [Aspergillus stella-maris]|uniref:ankyrin repeat-containing domain protein n=1 Tax=Aspergillus stella-maris TaxID=1810926 RepID=UPI003CCC954B
MIGSGNTLVKDAATRDQIVAELGEDCICVEMEAAGLMNHFPCLVIRGICDYADSHKNDRWQRYASATAAAYTKELLTYVPGVEVQETKRALEVLESVHQQISDVQQTTVATKATTDSIRSDLHTEKIRHWLSPPDPSTNANHARTLHHNGTGVWLLENPVFQSWHLGRSQHLWLQGLAGCGKTILSATVLDYLAKGKDSLVLSFFFDFGDTTKQTLNGMLRSLAFQIYQSGVDSAVNLDMLFHAHQTGSSQPATKALLDIVHKMLAVQSKIYIVLDALDESTTRDDIIIWIKDVVSQPDLVHVQLLCTSRPESEFLRHIPSLVREQNCLPLDTQAVDSDIRSWVTAQLSQRHDFTEKSLSQDLVKEIQKKVGDGADGMFRWAFCQLDSLARCRHKTDIRKALASLPRDLNETYRRMYASIPEELRNDAIRLLQFLVHSKRPLTLAETKEVIATQIEDEPHGFDINRRLFCETDVLDYCPSLVTVVDAAEKELHLAHFSVKEYLSGMEDFNKTTASISIMRTCLTYLTDISSSHRELQEEFPMARYAAEVWTAHAVLASACPDIVQMIVGFLTKNETFEKWARLYQADRSWDTNPDPPQGSRLYYACLAGLVEAARDIIQYGADVNAQGGHYGNALQAASFNGHQETVRLLLDKGADVNAQGGDYGNALQAASSRGYQEIVRLLLDKGADINMQGGQFGNALQAALLEGYQEIVRLLLDKGADVNVQGGYYGNALQAALSVGYQETVRLLLDKGADINTQGGHYGNALQAASSRGYQEIVRLLLDKGADVNVQGGRFGNALQAASFNGHQEIVRLLLDKRADVNAQGGQFGNALQAALFNGYQEIVRLLLDKGADVNAQGGLYGNALQAASSVGYQETVRLLLDKGADINTQGGYHGNALQAALFNSHQEIVRLLLDKGADVNMQGGHYSNALQVASLRGYQEIIRLLLDKGADINMQGGYYGNALQAASFNGYQEIVRLLLDKGADVNAQGGQFGNALQAASEEHHGEIIKLLKERGATTPFLKRSLSMTATSQAKKLRLAHPASSE